MVAILEEEWNLVSSIEEIPQQRDRDHLLREAGLQERISAQMSFTHSRQATRVIRLNKPLNTNRAQIKEDKAIIAIQ